MTTNRLVTLKFDGDLAHHGFRVSLEIGLESLRPELEMTATLPPAPSLLKSLNDWQYHYRSLNQRRRIKPKEIYYLGSVNLANECRHAAQTLCDRLVDWIESPSFAGIDRRLREALNGDDNFRILLRTGDRLLDHLPWHCWDAIDRYPNVELTLSYPTFERPILSLPDWDREKIRILAILGHQEGIDVDTDRQLLAALPNAEVVFLVEPLRSVLNDYLWDQSWDILFFAGHSQTERERGVIDINPEDSLTLDELRYGIRQAIARGLHLGIFNSCDGLGLAYELESLHLPQLIVMREPVPDPVAQNFLKYFLAAFAGGKPLHLAERTARERLQGLEKDYPCASWLPILHQNPAIAPLDWQGLRARLQQQTPELLPQISSNRTPQTRTPQTRALQTRALQTRALQTIFHVLNQNEPLTSPYVPESLTESNSKNRPQMLNPRGIITLIILTTLGIMGIRLLGLFQGLELKAYDVFMASRPVHLEAAVDPHLLVVEITPQDTEIYGYPLEDKTLAKALEKLGEGGSRVIGLDLHRAQKRGAGREVFLTQLKESNVITVCSFGQNRNLFSPLPELAASDVSSRMGFSDLEIDVHAGSRDSARNPIRRQLLSYDPKLAAQNTSCSTPYSFAFQLAFQFLAAKGVHPITPDDEGNWQFGSQTFKRLPSRMGGYQNLDGQSNQILLNYRFTPKPAQRVSFDAVLKGQVGTELIDDRIVLIGTTDPIAGDLCKTPYGELPGVWVHAHAVSQIVQSALEKRSLVWTLPQWYGIQWGDGLWVLIWSSICGIMVWKTTRLIQLSLGGITLLIGHYYICQFCFIQGGWLPLVPSSFAMIMTTVGILLWMKEYRFWMKEYRLKSTKNRQ